jgi:heme/copper-type cytochrome/quinol oxidase subunit 2
LAASIQGFQILLVTIAVALLGAGIALRFLPTGSHRTKEAAGSLIDNALIMAGLIALGIYLLVFVSRWAITLTGEGDEISRPEVHGPSAGEAADHGQ